ncbi:permease [Anaerolineales bacterium]
MSANPTPYFPKIDTDRRAFLIVALLAIVWIILYNNLQSIADWITYTLLQLSQESHFGASLNFFLYDVPKILLLLSGMIFLITLLQTFIDTNKVRDLVEKRGEGLGNLMASILGAITPFCSCSSVPLFIGFVQAGIPLGITFSFLITSPIMNEIAFVLLLGLFGWKIALLYLASGIMIGLVGGLILGRMKLENQVEEFVYAVKPRVPQPGLGLDSKQTWLERFQLAAESTREIIGKVWLFVIIGIGIGAFIHGFVPEDALTEIMGAGAWWSVPVAVLLGIPLYSNAAGIIPIVSALLGKGAALGTVLAFMMSVVALSLPEMIILRKVLKPPLIAIFVTVVAISIIITGYLFNLLI